MYKKFIISIAFVVVILLWNMLFQHSATSAFDRDFFPDGRPISLIFGQLDSEDGRTWCMVGGSKVECDSWAKSNGWTERSPGRMAWDAGDVEYQSLADILARHGSKPELVEKLYIKSIHGGGGFFVILRDPAVGGYSGVLIAART